MLDAEENHYSNLYIEILKNFKQAVETQLALLQLIQDKNTKNLSLEKVLIEIRELKHLLPICVKCKKIRDDDRYWNELDSYLEKHSEYKFSYGLCKKCFRELYPDYSDQVQKKN